MGRTARRGDIRLLALAKARFDQLHQRIETYLFVGTVSLQRDDRTLAGRQHHDPHNGFCIHTALIAGHPDLALVFGGELSELGRCARVKTELVDDFDVFADHSLMMYRFNWARVERDYRRGMHRFVHPRAPFQR